MKQDDIAVNKKEKLIKEEGHLTEDKNAGQRLEPTRIETLPSFTLAGISIVTSNETELSKEGKIGPLFEQFHLQNIGVKLGGDIKEIGHYSCYFHYDEIDFGRYEVIVGIKLQDKVHIPGLDMITTFTVPAAKYAVFATERGPIIEVVQRTWADIWQWSQQNGNDRAFTGDFEYYSNDINPNDGQAEIYIAIK